MLNKCRICGGKTQRAFSLGDLYISDFLKEEQKDDPDRKKFKLEMMVCEKCGLAQLSETTPPSLMYGQYWYRSGLNNTMKHALKNIVDSCQEAMNPQKGDVWVDIACNDGTLLSFVPDDIIKIGIDPADDSYKVESSKHANVIVQDYFSETAYRETQFGSKNAKIITTIAMLYDLDDPLTFLKEVNNILDDDGLFVIQMSYTPLMIKQLAFDNICHEHVCYYSLVSLKNLLQHVDMQIVDCELNDVNGGSIRVYAMKNIADVGKYRTAPARDVANFRVNSFINYEEITKANRLETYIRFYEDICVLREQTMNFIIREKKKGKSIWGYGASTKGNTLLQWYGLNQEYIDAIAEVSPYKFGLYTVGTKIPIRSEKIMREILPDYLLVLPWHFVYEFRKRERKFFINGGKFIIPCPKFELISG